MNFFASLSFFFASAFRFDLRAFSATMSEKSSGAAAARRAVETDANVPSSGVSFAALAADARDAAAAATTTTF